MSVMHLARAEREELRDLLSGLSPEQWRAPSLCAGWTVQDVVAHMLSYEELGPRQLAERLARGLLSVDRSNAIGLREYGTRTPEELLRLLDGHLTPTGLTAAMGGAIALTDGMIHQQDIRRPLGLPRQVPAERLVPALRTALFAPTLLGALRVRDVRLVATDIDWSFGRGPEVRGAAEALLMTVAGRPAAVADLSGPGQERIARRLTG
ncbi:maleylpyruvate isomerase family mycothiol-dependent enzyme [Blastococcus goldschmidtiae]|uniref:Maleylpyruvate isomerase family mycothiol-dependent enzyme n=1 Tax=Blastococcus goldschmidtiae TaxID=3075546 RepID=A0ABU2K8I4_9ACTN|nr:maleylpyruvate isomerase family mycothiol-dependent enzyme [Blastococcus sp. DSM 46792]MDT0276494.1 maleylpyruvate isomerase family mycothiol-dependent enzyme [Blastococcus sp. DSM 46792]